MRTGPKRPVILIAVAVFLGLVEAATLESGHGSLWLRLVVVAVAGAGLLLRHRSTAIPAAAAGVGWLMVAASGAPVDSLALFVLSLYAVGSCGYGGTTVLASAGPPLLVVLPAVTATAVNSSAADLGASLAWTVVLYGLAWSVGVGLDRLRGRATRAERVAAESEEAGRELLRSTIAEERRRMAQDLHDVISHSVTLMSVQAGAAARVIDTDPDAASQSLVAIQRVGAEAVDELRRLLNVLRDDGESSPRTPHPGLASAESLCENARATGLDVTFRGVGDLTDIAPGPSVASFRVLQEALTNARRHGGTCRVDVRVVRARAAVEIDVVNGFGHDCTPAADSTGHGLAGMRERVALYGGLLDAGPTDDGRWAVRARIPLPPSRTGSG